MKKIILSVLIAFLLSSCAPVKQNILKPFNKLQTLPKDIVSAVKDKEGKIWIVGKDAIYLNGKEKRVVADLNMRLSGIALHALGATKGFYLFYRKESDSISFVNGGYAERFASGVKYFNGDRIIDVVSGQIDTFSSYIDSKNRLWVSHKQNMITVVSGQSNYDFEYKMVINSEREKDESEKEKTPLSFYEDTKNRVWIYSNIQGMDKNNDTGSIDGVLCYDNGEIYSFPLKEKDDVLGVLELPSGEILVSSYNNGNNYYDYVKSKEGPAVLVPSSTNLSGLKDALIVSSYHAKDGRIIVVAKENRNKFVYNFRHSLYLMEKGTTLRLKDDLYSSGDRGKKWGYGFVFCEDAEGSVWIGLKSNVLKVQPDGTLKEYSWLEGLKSPYVNKILSDSKLVYLFTESAMYAVPTAECYVFDNAINSVEYKTGWESFSSLCVPFIDANNDFWFVDSKDGWLKKYKSSGNEKALNVFEELEHIGKKDRMFGVSLISISNGIEDDILLTVSSKESWILKYKNGKVLEKIRVSDYFKSIADENRWNRLKKNAVGNVRVAFSPDGYIVMTSYHRNKKTYYYNKSSWAILESSDITGKIGLDLSEPTNKEDGSIVVNLRDNVDNKEVSYSLDKGKWVMSEKVYDVTYNLGYMNDKRKIIKSKDGTQVYFSGGDVYIVDKEGKGSNIEVSPSLRYEDRFVSQSSLWLVLKPEEWRTKNKYIANYTNFRIFKYDYLQHLSLDNKPGFKLDKAEAEDDEFRRQAVSTPKKKTKKRSEIKEKLPKDLNKAEKQTLNPPAETVKIGSDEVAYRYLLDGSEDEKRAAEKYFKISTTGKEFLKMKLNDEKDKRMIWIIEALLSK